MNAAQLADRIEAAMRLDTESYSARSEICACIDELRALAGAEVGYEKEKYPGNPPVAGGT